jgi:site-specific DNA-methyltransferase (adenine-specific)
VIEREKAEIGVLISMDEPTQLMRTEAASAGFYTSPSSGVKHPRLQILTVEELLAKKGIDYPGTRELNLTFKRAGRAKAKDEENRELF